VVAAVSWLLVGLGQVTAAGQSQTLPSVYALLLDSGRDEYRVSWEDTFTLPPQDGAGWSILTPAADSRLVYVSASGGNDSTGQVYLPGDSSIGVDPYHPAEAVLAYASIDSALGQVREGCPDYILLKRGDTWERSSSFRLKAGRSATERAVLTSYGEATERPMVKNGGVNLSYASFSAVLGIHFYASHRDPNSPEFVGFGGVDSGKGFELLSGYGGTASGGILIEDCFFEWFANNTVQDAIANGGVLPYLRDVIIRRNVIAHNYATNSHSQGLFSSYASILLEDNVFDHNGWYQQGAGDNAQEQGKATMFNHNTYFSSARETILRNNLFLRPSSISNKFTSNTSSGINQVKAWDILLHNNFYLEGEVVISLGGNDDQDNGPRFANIHVIDNVATHVGRTHPTGRSLGWGLDISDWQGGVVSGNIFSNWGDVDTLTNTYAISSAGHSFGVSVEDNIVDRIVSSLPLVNFADGPLQNAITCTDNTVLNTIQQNSSPGRLVATSLPPENSTFANNRYYSVNAADTWFTVGGIKYQDFAQYQAATGDGSSRVVQVQWSDAEVSLENYLLSQGHAADMESFAQSLYQQSRGNWDPALTAQAINQYFRAAYTSK
jgi:hypothetical protein